MGVHYSRKRMHTDEDKIAKTPQVKIILKHLPEAVGPEHKVDREKLADKMDKDPEFVSKQGGAKILNFYIPKLVEAGIVEKHVVADEKPAAPAPEAKGPDHKPAAEPKKKGGGKGKPAAAEAKAHEAEVEALEDGESSEDE